MIMNRKSVLVGLIITCAWPTVVHAQVSQDTVSENDAASTEAYNNEILVTAQKRSESAQDVPISLSVFSGDQLAESGVTHIAQLTAQLPNVAITTPYGPEAQPSFIIRGITMSDYSMTQQSPIAVYVDEVYKGLGGLQAMRLYDIERVEVLRGPQGTLYGKNATGGAVSFYTRGPTFDGTNGYLSVGYGNYDRRQAEGAINVQLSDTVAFRAAAIYDNANGWVNARQPGVSDLGAKDSYAIRGSLRFQPTQDVDITLKGSVARSRTSTHASISFNGPGGVNFTGTPPYDRMNVDFFTDPNWFQDDKNDEGFTRLRTEDISLKIVADLTDSLTLTSISSYDHAVWNVYEDADNTPLSLANFGLNSTIAAYSQDLRLSYQSGPVTALVGAYYNREKVRFSEGGEWFFEYATYDPVTGASSCAVDLFTGCRYENDVIQVKESSAVYANLNYEISPEIELMGGIRYTHDVGRLPRYEAHFDFHDGVTGVELDRGIITITEAPIKRRVDNNVSFKVGVNYKPSEDVLLYAHYSTGYRGSSFNGLAFADPASITIADPEEVRAWEVGEKVQLLDRRLSINGAAFYYKYKDQQFLGQSGTGTLQTLFNAPEATIWGAEVEVIARPVDALQLSFGGGYTHSRYGAGVINGQNIEGNPVIGAPDWTFFAAGSLTAYENENYAVKVNAQTNYTGQRYFDVHKVEASSQPGYWLVDANIGINFKRQGLEITAWARNLLQEKYTAHRLDLLGFLNQVFAFRGEPRTYGLRARLEF